MGRPPGSAQFRALLASCESDVEEAVQPHSIADARDARLAALASERASQLSKRGSTDSNLGKWQLPHLLLGSDLQQQLLVAAQNIRHTKKVASDTFKKMFEYLFAKKRTVSNVSAEANTVGVDRRRLGEAAQEGASFVVQFSGYLVGAMLTNLTALIRLGKYKPMMLVIRRKYDETPSKISVSFRSESKGPGSAAEKEQHAAAKVVQTRCHMSLLLKHASGEYVFVECQIPTILQAVDRTTEGVLRSLAGLKEVCKSYPLYVHEVTTDKYAANLRAEKMLSHGGITSHYTCDVHKLAAVQTRTLSYVPGHISAMIAGALALGESGALNGLRKSLGNVLEQRVKLLYGEPPDDPFSRTTVIRFWILSSRSHRICRTSCEAQFRSVCMCRGVSSPFFE